MYTPLLVLKFHTEHEYINPILHYLKIIKASARVSALISST